MATDPQNQYRSNVSVPGYYSEQPVSTGEWVWTMLVLAIPLVGFILTLVWAFGGSTKASKRNFCRAALIWMLISIGLSIVGFIVLALLGASLGSLINYSSQFPLN